MVISHRKIINFMFLKCIFCNLFLNECTPCILYLFFSSSTICPNNPGWPKGSGRNIWIWETKKRPYLPFHSTLGLLPDVSILNVQFRKYSYRQKKWSIILFLCQSVFVSVLNLNLWICIYVTLIIFRQAHTTGL